MSVNVLIFNDLQFSMETFDQSLSRADRPVTLLPEIHEAPIMFRKGEFRYVECITDSPIVADTAAEIGYDFINKDPLFYVVSNDIPVLF
jgi:hypothetical protein